MAVADVIESRARHFAQRYGADAETDYRRLLERKDVDIVNICTPSGLHAQIGIEAAQAGKHVIVEKPIALSLEDADALIRACAEAKVTLTVVLQNRYNPPDARPEAFGRKRQARAAFAGKRDGAVVSPAELL